MTDSTDNARGPERIWATPYDADLEGGTYCDAKDRPTAINHDAVCYIRADLAAPSPDVLADPRVRALVGALRSIVKPKYGLQGIIENGDSAEEREEYYASLARRYEEQARAALARITDTGGRKDG